MNQAVHLAASPDFAASSMFRPALRRHWRALANRERRPRLPWFQLSRSMTGGGADGTLMVAMQAMHYSPAPISGPFQRCCAIRNPDRASNE